MRVEKIILSIGAVLVGLFVAGIAFYIYQTTRTISPGSIQTITINKPTPTSGPAIPLLIDTPTNESVIASRVVSMAGKTDPKATVIVTTDTTDTVVTPTATGAFSLTLTLDSGENRIIVTSVMPDGQDVQKILTVSVTSENF